MKLILGKRLSKLLMSKSIHLHKKILGFKIVRNNTYFFGSRVLYVVYLLLFCDNMVMYC